MHRDDPVRKLEAEIKRLKRENERLFAENCKLSRQNFSLAGQLGAKAREEKRILANLHLPEGAMFNQGVYS